MRQGLALKCAGALFVVFCKLSCFLFLKELK